MFWFLATQTMGAHTASDCLKDNLNGLFWLLPMGVVAGTWVTLLVLATVWPRWQRYWLLPVAGVGLLVAVYYTCVLGGRQVGDVLVCNQLLVYDFVARYFHLLFMGTALVTLLVPESYEGAGGISWALALLGVLLGACSLVMAHHWISLYVSLTLLSMSTALLLYCAPAALGAEVSLKYLLYCMTMAALTLWGVSCSYGLTGVLTLQASVVGASGADWPLPVVLLLPMMASVLFTLGVVPFHFWLPDVYQGVPAGVLAYVATVPKLAAVAVLLRIGAVAQESVQYCLAWVALLTLVVGNVAALQQRSVKRMMAYATMAQGGLLVAGIAAGAPSSFTAVLYYSGVYCIMGWTALTGIGLLEPWAEGVRWQGYAGLGWRWPVLGVALVIVMLALIGLPPTAGFTGKWLLWVALWQRIRHTGGGLWICLGCAGLLSTLLSLYYYLRLPYFLFFRPAPSAASVAYDDWVRQGIVVFWAGVLLWAFWYAHYWLEALGG